MGSTDDTARPLLIALCGLPGSGKTTVARARELQTGAIRFSTDEWMAALGVDFFDVMRDRLQARLDELWHTLLERGQSVILEDGTWRRKERDELRHVAERCNAVTEMHYFDIPFGELWRRLEIRNATGTYGAVPITKELLAACLPRLQRPDEEELSLFDRYVVHTSQRHGRGRQAGATGQYHRLTGKTVRRDVSRYGHRRHR